MKKVIFVVLVSMSLILSACSDSTPEHVPFDQLSFVLEENPDYIGSYFITRTNELNAKWDEWGEWSPLDMSSRVVCFGDFSFDDYGIFRARSDYYWIEEGGCLKLQKKD